MDFYGEGVSGVDKEGIRVCIYNRPKHDERQSEVDGRPRFVEVPYARIELPGDRYTIVDQKVTLEHQRRWPELWRAFIEGQKGVLMDEGDMPIEQWAALARSRVMELKAMGIHSLRALASVPDGNLQKMGMGSRKERDQAKLALMERSDAEKAMAKQIRDQEQRITELEARLRQADAMPVAKGKAA